MSGSFRARSCDSNFSCDNILALLQRSTLDFVKQKLVPMNI